MTNKVEIVSDYPEDRLIATSAIPSMKIINSNGVEVKGQGISVDGMDNDVFSVTILGVPFPFYEDEFPHHVKMYNEKFKS